MPAVERNTAAAVAAVVAVVAAAVVVVERSCTPAVAADTTVTPVPGD